MRTLASSLLRKYIHTLREKSRMPGLTGVRINEICLYMTMRAAKQATQDKLKRQL